VAEITVRIGAAEGLHARPAALFVQAVVASGATVMIAKGAASGNATRSNAATAGSAKVNAAQVNAASILAVLTLAAAKGDEVTLSSSDEGAEAVLAGLANLLSATDRQS
jgi:phosphocarrier protein HPr